MPVSVTLVLSAGNLTLVTRGKASSTSSVQPFFFLTCLLAFMLLCVFSFTALSLTCSFANTTLKNPPPLTAPTYLHPPTGGTTISLLTFRYPSGGQNPGAPLWQARQNREWLFYCSLRSVGDVRGGRGVASAAFFFFFSPLLPHLFARRRRRWRRHICSQRA